MMTKAIEQKSRQMGFSVTNARLLFQMRILDDILTFLAGESYRIAIDHGFDYNDKSQQYALFHSEVSEGFETLRTPGKPSEKLAGYTEEEEELADVILRILGYSYAHNLKTIEAMFVKNEYNRQRPYKHGNKEF